ncbi:MAG: hypothetical protein V1850_05700, partial [Candidatus Bathyarchaeota archaeon]
MGASKRFRLFLLFTIIMMISLLTIATSECPKVQVATLNTISGQVIDETTGLPIQNATVAVWLFKTVAKTVTPSLGGITKTEFNGSYNISVLYSVGDNPQGQVYAYYDDLNTPGYDYLPMLQNVLFRSNYQQVSF